MDEQHFAITLQRQDRYQFAVTFDGPSGTQLTMDEPAPLGDDSGPNAVRVLGAAIGHCLSASLLFCLKKARVDVTGLRTTVTGSIIRNDNGRLRVNDIRVRLAPAIRPEDRQRISRCLDVFEDFCIVTQSVRQGIEVNVEVAAEEITSTV